MGLFASKNSTGRADELWPVLLLLLVVAVPTIGVLWFVGVAVENQQLAAKQRLTEAYQSNLLSIRSQITDDWDTLEQKVRHATNSISRPRVRFLEALASVPADSVVCFHSDETGELAYPRLHEPDVQTAVSDLRWSKAARLENLDLDLEQARALYEAIADDAAEQRDYVLAIQGQVRCLLKSDNKAAAIELVGQALEDEEVGPAGDPSASHAIANIELMAIEQAKSGPAFRRIWKRLHERVFSGRDDALPGPQRLFIMRRLMEISPNAEDLARLMAEDLASQFVARTKGSGSKSQTLRPSGVTGVWQRSTEDGRLTLLFKTDTVRDWATRAAAKTSLPPGVQVKLLPPADPAVISNAIPLLMGSTMPGWRLSLSHRDDENAVADLRSGSIHIWTAALVVLFSTVLGVVIARAFQRKLRVANLKNDLVGTVSHELKTPLASMRLLVETLLDDEHPDPDTTREYLQLIDKENVRLSRLIENFLTFSRMEQDRHSFQFADVSVSDVINEAVLTMGERLCESQCKLTINVDSHLADVWADKDGLVTVILNLLDNAHKYSGQLDPSGNMVEREIGVSARANGSNVQIAVQDNGIGLPHAATRRVFERFFQVDQSLVRQGQGCGLGLSIVEYIVRVHGGSVNVHSELGRGSCFEVTLPIRRGAANAGR